MKRQLAVLSALLLLAACETNEQDKEAIKAQVKEDVHIAEGNAERHTLRVANNLRDQTKKTAMKLREWWLTPLPNPEPPPVPPSYCYQVLQDIVCYRDALPGMTHKLVGYQGDGTPPPPTAQTKALPVSRIQKMNNAAAPDVRVANAKPVFVAPPTQVKEDKSSPVLDGAAAVGSEPLPDPNLSPQL
ncbi:MAG: hypothetical protein SFX19_08270 [Alphaproteobacteria bacterium]|nr:hypothetical protein [Alphaproteobacteria bacterium]